MRNAVLMVSTTLATGLSLVACQQRSEKTSGGDTMQGFATSDTAHAVVAAVRTANGRELGTLTLADSPEGIKITGRLVGLPPGDHGIHLHTVGQCTPPFTSAGAHWNPSNMEHGADNPHGPHLGDMRNITVSGDSSVIVSTVTPGGTLRGTNQLLDGDGAAVVIHAAADDYRTNPSGNSGDRVACGVVTAG